MMQLMSLTKDHWYCSRVALALLPFVIACGSSPTKPAVSPADTTDAADAADDDKPTSGVAADGDGKKNDTNKSDAGKSGKKDSSEAKSDKKATADDDDDDKAPTDDSRTTASVAAVIKERRKDFKKCYEVVRKDQPDLKGHVILKLVLDGAGVAKKIYIDDESTIRNQKISDCMIKLARTLTYPKSSKGLDKEFQYDFGFNIGQD
jgi:hypothetical protein